MFRLGVQRLTIEGHRLRHIVEECEVGDVARGFRHDLARLLGGTTVRVVFVLEGVCGNACVALRQGRKRGSESWTIADRGSRELAPQLFDGLAQRFDEVLLSDFHDRFSRGRAPRRGRVPP